MPPPTQRQLAEKLGWSLGKVNSVVKQLINIGLLDETTKGITPQGQLFLNKYRVKNAIIMAAGLSSRFAPLSFEKPKGLLQVRGEILIERQIKQLQAKNISDITLIVGYLKEQFFYLEEKYGVKIVVNEEYWKYNNTSSLNLVLEQLGNTYICSSDNYFVDNPFNTFEYKPYYSAEYAKGATDEYCLSFDKSGVITKVSVGGADQWYMIGHAYFDETFSKKFIQLFKQDYQLPEVRNSLWEDFYRSHLDELKLFIKQNNANIFEFDTVEELKIFDPHCVEWLNSKIIKNISSCFKCEVSDVRNFKKIKEGMTNNSFSFEVGHKRYVYRHPGRNTDGYIDRESESMAMEIAKKLHLDKTYISMDAKEGWKLSHFIDGVQNLDYQNIKQVKKAIGMLRELHQANFKVKRNFDVWEEINKFIFKLKETEKLGFSDFETMFSKMSEVNRLIKQDQCNKCLCHCDSYAPNFMVHGDEIELIDWEYSGNCDPAYDIGIFICCAEEYDYKDALKIFEIYFQRPLTQKELAHFSGYVALASFYWFVWALYQESCGKPVGHYLHLWYKNTKLYAEKTLNLFFAEEMK